MNRISLFFILFLAVALSTTAQPARRRAEQQAAASRNAGALTVRAQISFPTSASMPEDVVWRRDIYRQIDLTQDANAGLYYPIEPVGNQMNLFTYIFKLFMLRQIPVYEYRLDGNELFNDTSRLKPKAFLDNYHIYYEKTDRGTRIDDSDIPSKEVTSYYIKECAYYDQATSTFHTQVLALCPVMKREDDFGDGATSYPLFWVRYQDLAPFLAKQTIMTSNLNNAATMSMDDYFTKNMYRGKIYKTTNMLGRTLAQYCTTDSAMTKEQKRIEAEIKDFESNMWGDKAAKDSLDSIAKLDKKGLKVKKTKTRRSRTASFGRSRKTSNEAPASNSSARVTVRRQRH
ncbi:MAG: gliding motility protein GldN [Prevotella sp.]|nr:gliding motility protein GldN [Prevotella sp.]